MTHDPRPPRMYSDAERDARPRDLWGISQWIDWVESGPSRDQRLRRLSQAPPWARAEVEVKCIRRATRAQREAWRAVPEEAPHA